MRRGDQVTVSLPGDYGKPRPALVLQADAFATTQSVFVVPLTTDLIDAPSLRPTLEPTAENGLRQTSQAMVDKLIPAVRAKCGPVFGRVSPADVEAITRRTAALLGL